MFYYVSMRLWVMFFNFMSLSKQNNKNLKKPSKNVTQETITKKIGLLWSKMWRNEEWLKTFAQLCMFFAASEEMSCRLTLCSSCMITAVWLVTWLTKRPPRHRAECEECDATSMFSSATVTNYNFCFVILLFNAVASSLVWARSLWQPLQRATQRKSRYFLPTWERSFLVKCIVCEFVFIIK